MCYERKGTWIQLELFAALFFTNSFTERNILSRIQHAEVTPKPCFTLKDFMLFKFKGLHTLCGTRGEKSWPWPYKADLPRFLL